ncbi:ABC transporter ATP-binding protein, putative [Fulvivirga imtechensis AK7]|uniref:ABC transporter ATP-binding protein, putative n=1 Tax=Fulvivirga imtechensis AK7 TaxID=1237149 RepID=L8K0H0_9BACT|nr:ATP-binding cassette domain-containing protein [Fulvivirga imtechensis]ELR73898.1 ABC transporter ATP-binding protein, putative [Fulvivirga imtechensis AK7]
MSEELLKAIIQLFAIVAKERVTEDERANIKEFLSVHLNQEAIGFYLSLFDKYCCENDLSQKADLGQLDDDTLEFVGDWARIMAITKEVNKALTMQQKVVLVAKIIELVFADGEISERQGNLIFYIGEALKLSRKDTILLRNFVTGQDLEELSSSDILIIDEGSGEYDLEGPRLVAKNLTGLIAILRLPEIETYFIKYLGISTLTLNGIPLKSRKIDIFPTGSTIRGNKIETIYYSDVVSEFLQGHVKSTITFSAEHIFYHFRGGRAGLQNVNIFEKGGKLIGIMGASGSGKSTLLNVINGAEAPSSGRVLINGINIHENHDAVRGVIGYIPQDDLLIEELTVFENLYYAARLCFSQYSKEDTEQLVNKVLLSLGLSEIKDLRVGSPLDKTISGGQRKRVNIGLELLREPSVLFVDEPTSGLSSQDSENIMDLLKELTLRGKMIFVVIHQPSSDIFKMFDNLLILDVGGLQIYYGNPIESVTYFKEIVNAANKNQSSCPECGNVNAEQVFSIIETKVVNEYGRLTNTRKISPGQWYQYFRERIKLPKVKHVKESINVTQEIPNWFRQFGVYVTRDVLSKVANTQYMVINLLQAPVLAIFMAFLVRYYTTIEERNPAYSFYENDNIPVYFFMSIIVALFMGLTVSAEEIFRDRKIRKRERFLDLSRSSYLSSKVFILFLISAIQTGSFIIIGNWILEIDGMGVRFWMILFSASCFANMLGLNISASFNSAVTIYILIPILLIPQLLLSGVVISFDKFNPTVSSQDEVPWIGEVMASRWAFEAAMVTQFRDNPYEKMFYEVDKKTANAEYKKLYYIPRLETELTFVFNNMSKRMTPMAGEMRASLELLRNEIGHELTKVGEEKFSKMERLVLEKFDSATYFATQNFLNTLKQLYINRYNAAVEEKALVVESFTSTQEGLHTLDSLRLNYQNEAIVTALQNTNITHRVIAMDGRLVQKIYPIYFDDFQPTGPLDFRAKFFVPKKHFAGLYINTLYFNIVVIWVMSLILFITLYYRTLQWMISLFITKRKKR